ncbi:hypothetical protein D3C76_1116490 [compost metagenome]
MKHLASFQKLLAVGVANSEKPPHCLTAGSRIRMDQKACAHQIILGDFRFPRLIVRFEVFQCLADHLRCGILNAHIAVFGGFLLAQESLLAARKPAGDQTPQPLPRMIGVGEDNHAPALQRQADLFVDRLVNGGASGFNGFSLYRTFDGRRVGFALHHNNFF